ncbi:uncharacterized protein LOC110102406 [Dendrobium catenatum]|uniref:uncharacterized protein LOC110102406 n=1 Tax=Dendrobium catenatum TaxID=906689 RepID=UPI0009F42DFE|nr:uncharacterized protein LOC110102406 [Dendrobium catenatum]
MAGVPSSALWGKAFEPMLHKNKGFFNLDSDGSKSPSRSRSFKEVLSGSTSAGDDLPSLTQSTFNGVHVVLLSDDEVLKLASQFQFTLVGKFGLLDSRYAAIQLSNDLDYSRVFTRSSYFIFNYQMQILKWTPFFDIKEESSIVPIWISFPSLRLHFFNPKVLHALGLIFGRPLQTDQATASRTRPYVARVLVEVDISKKHPKEIWDGSKASGYLQKAEFEEVPDFYSHCKIHGHAQNDCFKLHSDLKKTNVMNNGKHGSTGNKTIYMPASNNNVGTQENQVEPLPISHNLEGILENPKKGT